MGWETNVSRDQKASPWISGVVDTLVGARFLMGTQIPHRNRLALILMDSALETACRAFLRHRKKIKLADAHEHRDALVKVVRQNLKDVDPEVWDNLNYYYTEIRNDLYHESAGKTVTDIALLEYQDTVEFVINKAHEVQIGPMVSAELDRIRKAGNEPTPNAEETGAVPLPELRYVPGKVEKVLVAVAAVQPKGAKEINEFFKKEGDGLRVRPEEFTGIVARNTGSKRFFYFSREQKSWGLSSAGQFKLSQLSEPK